MPMKRPTCVESTMMRLSSLADRQRGVGADQPRRPPRSTECSVASSETLPDDGVIDAAGPDLHLAVVVVASPA